MRLNSLPVPPTTSAAWPSRLLSRAARRWAYALAALVVAVCVSGCGALRTAPPSNERPSLQLSPQALPQAFEAVQRMQVSRQGQTRSLDAMLEASQDHVQLAILQLNQTIAVLQWDGQQLQTRLAPGWPKVIEPEKLLSDLQYVWWPYQAIAQALPTGWSLYEQAGLRELRHDGQSVLRIEAQRLGESNAQIELVDTAAAYTVTLAVQGSVPSFAATTAPAPNRP